MANRIAFILGPVFLAFFGLSAVTYVEYQKHKLGAQAFDTEELGPVDYIRARFAAYQEKRAVAAAVRDMSIALALPAAPEGWERAKYEVAHGEAITGATFEPSAIVKDTEKSIQDEFRLVQRKKRLGAAASYIKGDQIVALRIRKRETLDAASLAGGLAIRMNETAEGITQPNPVWHSVGATQFELLPQQSEHYFSGENTPVSYRRMEGNFGTLFDIFVFTNADDAAVRAVLEQVDYALLEDYVYATLKAQDPGGTGPVETGPVETGSDEQAPDAEAAEQSPPTQADDAALGQAAAHLDGGEEAASFLQKLGNLFASSGGAAETEEEERKRMVCTVQQGYKRCVFPKED